MKWLIQRFILQMDNYPLLINRNIKVHIRIKTFLKKSKRGRVRQVERNSITGGGEGFTHIKYPISLWALKLEVWKKKIIWNLKRKRQSNSSLQRNLAPHWMGFCLPVTCQEGFLSHTIMYDVKSSRRDETLALCHLLLWLFFFFCLL